MRSLHISNSVDKKKAEEEKT